MVPGKCSAGMSSEGGGLMRGSSHWKSQEEVSSNIPMLCV